MTDADFRLVIETVRWERIQLIMLGRIEGHGSLEGFHLYFEEDLTGERADVGRHISIDGREVRVRFSIMQALDLYPLSMGTWMLWGEVDGAERFPVHMDETFDVDAREYGGLFTNGYHYWVFPVHRPVSDQFGLTVSYRGNPGRTDLTSGELRANMVRRWFKNLRASLYVIIYNISTKLVKRDGHHILFTSDSRSELSGNLLDVYNRIVERGLDQEFNIMTMFKESITAKRRPLDKFRFPVMLARADVILLDDFHPMLYKVDFALDVKIIQLWHASGAFKTVGYSRIGKPGGPSPMSAGHKNYTAAIVSSQHDVPFYAEAFGIPEERVIATGIPRLDAFFDDEHKQRTMSAVYESLPEAVGRKVIMFAPTFRGTGPSTAYYNTELIDFDGLYRLCLEQDAVVVFKMHPFIIEPLIIPQQYQDRFIDSTRSREINDLLLITDLVITDYSSLVFEYSTLGRPMLFFAYDLDEYVAERDFYEHFEDFVPGKIVRTFDELLRAIATDDFEAEKVDAFARTHLGHLDNGSTDRVIDELILG